MKKIQEFRRRASDCRGLSMRGITPEVRQHYRELAEMWDRLADERRDFKLFITRDADDAAE